MPLRASLTEKKKNGLTWGLGVEHEMLMGVGSPPGTVQRYLSSKSVMQVLMHDEICKAFACAERAIGQAFVPDGRPPMVCTGGEGMAEVAIGRAAPEPTPLGRALLQGSDAEKVAKALATKVPHTTLQLLARVLLPHVMCISISWDLPVLGVMDAWSNDGFQFREDAFQSVYEAKDKLVGRVKASRQGAGEVLAQVLCGVPGELARYEAQLAEACVPPHSIVAVHLGDAFSMLHRSVVIRNNQKKGAHADGRDVLAAAIAGMQRCVIGLLAEDKHGLALELDQEFVEAKTLRFRCATVPKLLKELHMHENRALQGARRLDASARILPHSGYAAMLPVGSRKTGKPMYAGSHHFWFTLPHDEDAVSGDPQQHVRFAQMHSAFAYALQWLQPLLLACTGGDPRAIGNGTQYPRANMRGTLNSLAGAGTVDVCANTSRMEVTFPKGQPFAYYASDEELRKDPVRQEPPHEHTGRTAARMYALVPSAKAPAAAAAEMQPVLSCTSVGREQFWPWPNPRPATLPGLQRQGRTRAAAWLPARVMREAYQAGFTTMTGNDFRFTWCERFALPLQPGWRPVAVRMPGKQNKKMGGADEFVVRFVQAATGVVSEVAPLLLPSGCNGSSNSKQPLVGFEFRMMDNLPREALRPLMHVFDLAAAASDSVKRCGQPVRLDKDWSQLVASVLVEGRFAQVSRPYLAKLAGVLGLPQQHARSMDARAALLWASRALHHRYAKKHPWVRLMLGSAAAVEAKDPPEMPDTNLHAWIDAVNDSPVLLRQIADASYEGLGPGWKYDLPYLRAAAEGRRLRLAA